MSRSTYTVKHTYTGTGALSAYTFDFKITSLSHLLVIELDDTGVETQRVRGTDVTYLSSVTYDAVDGGGTVNLAANLTTDYTLILLLADDAPVQNYEFSNKTSFTLKRFEHALDNIVGAVQRLTYRGKQAFKLNDADDSDTFDTELPAGAADSIDCLIQVNATGDGLMFGPEVSDLATVTYVNTAIGGAAATDATALVNGLVRLAGDLGGTADAPTVPGLATKENSIVAGTTSQYWRGDKSWQTLDKTAVGLGNVDNTSDANKPISTATQTALDLKADATALALKANIASPALTGTPTAPTAAPLTNSTQLATTEYVDAAVAAGGGGGGGGLTSINSQTGPAVTIAAGTSGTDVAIAAAANTVTVNIPTASAVNRGALSSADWSTFNAKEGAIAAGTVNDYWRGDKSWQTLNKAAVGLANVDNTSDANKPISTATQTALDLKAPLASPTLTGTPAAPTAAPGTNTTQIATTAFVTAAVAAGGGGGTTFDSSTATFTYAGSATYTPATLSTAPDGTFITLTGGASAQDNTQTNAAPTQTTAAMNNGILITAKPFGSAGSSNTPSRFMIKIGTGFTSVNIEAYSAASKGGQIVFIDFFNTSVDDEYGTRWSYNPTSGILTLTAGLSTSSGVGRYVGVAADGTDTSAGYFYIKAN
jgi:hypothetical protein